MSSLIRAGLFALAAAGLPACTHQAPQRLDATHTLEVKPAFLAVRVPYARREWVHWVDADGDCQDTRTEVLIAESEVPVTFVDTRHCTVARGRWTCPYTGAVFEDPRALDVDHLVPLEVAHSAGGDQWLSATKRAYANDLDEPDHLVAVAVSANRSKGSRSPDQWMPPDRSSWCWYARAWAAAKKRWGLRVTGAEQKTVMQIENECDGL